MDNTRLRDQIQKLNPALTMNQRAFVLDAVVKVFPEMSEADKDKLWTATEFITQEKKEYLLHLYFSFKGQKESPDKWLIKNEMERQLNTLINL